MRALVIIGLLALAVGCVKNKPASYVVTGAAAYGAAYGPSSSSAGLTTGVRIHDRNGLFTRNLLVLVAAAFKARFTEKSNYQRYERETCSNGVCTVSYGLERTSSTYEVAAPTEKDVAELKAFMDLLDATDFIPLETSIDIAIPALGGDTSGVMVELLYRGEPFQLGPFPAFTIGGGLGVGRMKFADRDTRSVDVDNMGSITTSDAATPYTYKFFGYPIRFDAYYGPLSVYLKVDLNTFTILELFTDEYESPSPWHFGTTYRIGPLFLGAEATFTALRPGSMTFGAEAGIAF